MRTLLLLVILSFVACTVQPSGARCEQDLDCDPATGDLCRVEFNYASACQRAPSCVCCPTNAEAAARVPGCTGVSTATDAGADASADR
jgi:hypothetical protein